MLFLFFYFGSFEKKEVGVVPFFFSFILDIRVNSETKIENIVDDDWTKLIERGERNRGFVKMMMAPQVVGVLLKKPGQQNHPRFPPLDPQETKIRG